MADHAQYDWHAEDRVRDPRLTAGLHAALGSGRLRAWLHSLRPAAPQLSSSHGRLVSRTPKVRIVQSTPAVNHARPSSRVTGARLNMATDVLDMTADAAAQSAAALYRHASHGLVPAVSRPADDRADGLAPARRRAGGVEQRDAGLSGAAARRLCIRSCARPAETPPPGLDPSRPARARRADAADRADRRGAARRCLAGALGALAAGGLDRTLVFRRRRAGAADAALVRHQPGRGGSLCALRRIEPRQLCRSGRLSADRRTVDDAASAELAVDDRLRRAGAAGRRLRASPARAGRCQCPGNRDAGAEPWPLAALDAAGLRPVGVDAVDDDASHHRYRRNAAALGAAARPLSAELFGRLFGASLAGRLADAAGAADHTAGRRPRLRRRLEEPAALRRARPHAAVHRRGRAARRNVPLATSRRPPHLLLSGDVGRRRAGRPVLRADRTAGVRLGL